MQVPEGLEQTLLAKNNYYLIWLVVAIAGILKRLRLGWRCSSVIGLPTWHRPWGPSPALKKEEEEAGLDGAGI
jgi:hypothetical protein